jgi:hypothetical protein
LTVLRKVKYETEERGKIRDEKSGKGRDKTKKAQSKQ